MQCEGGPEICRPWVGVLTPVLTPAYLLSWVTEDRHIHFSC